MKYCKRDLIASGLRLTRTLNIILILFMYIFDRVLHSFIRPEINISIVTYN